MNPGREADRRAANPAETDALNPYQSPTQAGGPVFVDAGIREYAVRRIALPGEILIWLGVLSFFAHGLLFIALVLPAINMTPRQRMAAEAGFTVTERLVTSGIVAILGVVLDIIVILGSVRMKRLRNRGLSMAAAIIAVIPCFSPCCVFGIPFGIWALVVLNDANVRAAFGTPASLVEPLQPLDSER